MKNYEQYGYKLKNGSRVDFPQLGCILNPDERNRNFPICATMDLDLEPISKRWEVVNPIDQGAEGCCVSIGIAHELLTPGHSSVLPKIDLKWAKDNIYWPAQRIDPWPGGAYVGAIPKYEGTSLEAGLKVAVKSGFIESYRWAFTWREVLIGVGYSRPAVIAVNWKKDMIKPDANGYIKYSGRTVGGHCLLMDEIDFYNLRIGFQQSWGNDYGVKGRVYMSIMDVKRMIRDNGQVAFLE